MIPRRNESRHGLMSKGLIISILISVICLALYVGLFAGCAISYLDRDGRQHVLGFVKMKIPIQENLEEGAGETVDVSSIGILVYSSPVHSGISFGYTQEQITGLKNNVLVLQKLKNTAETSQKTP